MNKLMLENKVAIKSGEQPGGAKMLEYSKHFVYFPAPECEPIDQVIQVCNGAFL